ncbi:MAG: ProQ/FINO family protein [Hydrogenophaga sp.]|uniref:ProQ/FINO family protein n=1 Tax=Hydrogenophaga sp. TaxID=1904254 RepID=UPI00262B9A5C|nr:ProQ/FINO family protein [Hydrogenophaga sp.]MDM7942138.1 ProQ/FINO family protein [Hydrogenophaga sp.]
MNPNAPEPTDAAATAPTESGTGNPPPARSGRNRRGPAPQRAPHNGANPGAGTPPQRHHPMLDQLAQSYPALFGEVFRPLKRGIFQDLLEAQPEVFDKDGLKTALALHTRSTRYLTAVASGQPRCDLSGQPVEDLAPEHVHHALVEVFRRRQGRAPQDLRPKLRQRIEQAFEASGLGAEAYAALVQTRDEALNTLTQEALDAVVSRAARDAALLRAFEASGKTVEAFADMYGMGVADANRTLERARSRAVKPA